MVFSTTCCANPDGNYTKLRVRSLVGLVPLFAVERLEEAAIAPFKEFRQSFTWFLKHRQDVAQHCCNRLTREGQDTRVLSIVNPEQLSRILKRLWDSDEFLSDYGLRSLSKVHEAAPFEFDGRRVRYEPGEADTKIKGGNSNWRGPLWFPTTFLMIESLRKLHKAYGPLLDIEDAQGQRVTAGDMAQSLADRMISIFGARCTRPASGVRRRRQIPARPALARPLAVLRIFSRRQRCRVGCFTSDRVDRVGGIDDR